MTYTKGISLDVAKPMPAKPIQAKQFDTNSRFLNITVTKAGAPVNLTDDHTVIINIRRADGEAKAFECTVNQDGTISAPIPNWALEVYGEAVCDVSIISAGEKKLTTHSFVIDIADAVYGNDDISKDETYDILVGLLGEVSAVKEAVPTVLAAADEAKLANEEAQKAKEQATDLVESAREEWNAKYSKPDSGIPKADLSNEVQTSLSKADTALQEHQDISGKVDKVEGKGLSSNDYTNTDKSKVDSIDGIKRDLTNKASTDYVDKAVASVPAGMPSFVDSVDEMTDTSKAYVLNSTGTIWAYKSATTEQEVTVTDQIEGVEENPYYDNSRLPSSGTTVTSQNGSLVSPFIYLDKPEYQGKEITIHLEGATYLTEANTTYVQFQILCASKNILVQRGYSTVSLLSAHGFTGVINSETSAVLTMTPPILDSANKQYSYIRFGANGSVANSNIFITYTDMQTVTSEQWVDTGVQYGGSGLDEETLAKIYSLNNEGADPTTLKLLSQPVLDFYNASEYPSDDYTTSHLSKITYPCRADIPIPFNVKWNHNENAMRTTLVVDTKAIGTVNAYRMRIYDVTGFDNYPIYNLLPNTRYYYKVTHVMADGSLVEAKSGNFLTSSESIRLLYIDGTQNVRDLGGWTGLDGKKVKYGNIVRGATLSDSSFNNLIVTGKGRLSLGELKVQAELNLGASDIETSIASNCVYTKIGYNNYAGAITDATSRGYFKTALEWIVDCLNNSKPIYMHCQGGCDRTGTLAFQLLGLLGVSESDLAKEYELSSFSDIGFGRLRTTTKAVDTYDYVGMVEALKTYSGDTITDKFYDFATTGCGISADTITSFRNLMLE